MRGNMVKRNIGIIIVLALLVVFVSCSNNISKVDVTSMISFSGDEGRSLSTASELPGKDSLYWYYKAEKTGGGFDTGSKTTETAVVEDGYGLNKTIGPLSIGEWKFTLKAYAEKSGNGPLYPVYQGEVTTRINAGALNRIDVTVDYIKNVEGKGTVVLEDVSFVTNSTVKPDKMKIEYKEESAPEYSSSTDHVEINAETTGLFSYTKQDVPSGIYMLRFTPMVGDKGQDVPVEKAIIVLNGRTTKITGSLSENPEEATFNVTLPTETYVDGGNGVFFVNSEKGLEDALKAALTDFGTVGDGTRSKIYIDADIVLSKQLTVNGASQLKELVFELNGSKISSNFSDPMLVINGGGTLVKIEDQTKKGALEAKKTVIKVNEGSSCQVESSVKMTSIEGSTLIEGASSGV